MRKSVRKPQAIFFSRAKDVPNNNLPVLVYRSAVDSKSPRKDQTFRTSFKKNGWVQIWTDTIYDYTHFHSNAHELLGVAEGKVTLRLGGSTGRLFSGQSLHCGTGRQYSFGFAR